MGQIYDRDLEFAYRVIDESDYGVMCVFDYNLHALPFSAVREESHLYFASGKSGLKVDIFEHEDMIKVVFVSESGVPEPPNKENIEKELADGNLRFLQDRVFTNEYQSAIADGQVELVKDREERERALRLLYDKYYSDRMKYFDAIKEQVLDQANIYKIQITNVTAKERRSKQ